MFKSYVTSIIRSSIKRLLLLNSYKVNRNSHTVIDKTVITVPPRGQSKIEAVDEGGQYKCLQHPNIYSRDQLGHYLAGLLEGDGHISIPALGKTTLNRVLNPRFVFTFHKKNLKLYKLIQSELGGIGRFQSKDRDVLRYIIGGGPRYAAGGRAGSEDIEGINILIRLLHNKFRTPKIITFNKLIQFMTTKYNLNFEESLLDLSKINSNSWFTGFSDAEGYFGINFREADPNSNTRRYRYPQIGLVFRLDQRSFDRSTLSSMSSIMEKIANFLSCNLITVKKKSKTPLKLEAIERLSVEIAAAEPLNKIENLVNSFNQYPLLGIKLLDFKDWNLVYSMIKNKEHLTESGRLKIKLIKSNMNSNRLV